jgi:ribosomal protein S18 acetylase RimI-like enzyme
VADRATVEDRRRVNAMRVRPKTGGDAEWARSLTVRRWGAECVVVHRAPLYPAGLPGFVAEDADGALVGMATYALGPAGCGIVTLETLSEGRGIGRELVGAVIDRDREARCSRVRLITTNDDLRAIGFYQRRGFRLVAVHRDAVTRSRAFKPSIPEVGTSGIRILDEIELELVLDAATPCSARQE